MESLDCASTAGLRAGGCARRGGGVGKNPLASALAFPALRRCLRSAGVMALGLPLLRFPRADITAEISAFVGGLVGGLAMSANVALSPCGVKPCAVEIMSRKQIVYQAASHKGGKKQVTL